MEDTLSKLAHALAHHEANAIQAATNAQMLLNNDLGLKEVTLTQIQLGLVEFKIGGAFKRIHDRMVEYWGTPKVDQKQPEQITMWVFDVGTLTMVPLPGRTMVRFINK